MASRLALAAAVLLFGSGLAGRARTAAAVTMTSFQEGVSPTTGYEADATFIRKNAPTEKHDSTRPNELIIGSDSSKAALRTLLEFDLSAIDGEPNYGVSLVLNTYHNSFGDSITVYVHKYDFDLNEVDSTWLDPDGDGDSTTGDPTDGGTIGTLLTSTTIGPLGTPDLDVIFPDTPAFRTAVADALASADKTLRLMLKQDPGREGAYTEGVYFCSNEYSTLGRRPELIVSHVPEPCSLVMLCCGGLYFLFRRKRPASR